MTTTFVDLAIILPMTLRCAGVGAGSTVCSVVTIGMREAFQKLDDVSTGLAAENPILMLKANDVEPRCVQEIGGLRITVDRLVVDLEPHGRRIVIGAARIVHGNDTGLQIRPGCRNRPMQIMGEGGDAAAARKMIADEAQRAGVVSLHCSCVPRQRGRFVRVRDVGTCIFAAGAASVALVVRALQQEWNRTIDTRVRHEARHALGPGLYDRRCPTARKWRRPWRR